ncbi:MAG: excinuclease ABC subunit UvrC [Bacteroidales bacterium]|nr:excinuclease ABC subunit UvrC [Bacteroidales bacterium]
MKTKEEQRIEHIKEQLATLPTNPGVYQYFDKNDTLIYVGKAKNLKRRVSSYFNKEQTHPKTRVLVSKIVTIKHFIVASEQDALLLENNLIKKYKPRYNVLLKDDKTYPWIVIKNEPFPRIFMTRHLVKNGSQYFGPYANVKMVKNLLAMVKQLYKPRTCSLALNMGDIAKGKFNTCLEYHIKNCNAPCVARQSESEYLQSISDIKDILKGNIGEVIRILKNKMLKYASEMRYEEAGEVKEQLEELERYQSHSTIVSPSINNIDVYSILDDTDSAYINFLKIVNGAVVQLHTLEIKKQLNETPEELLGIAITEIRQNIQSDAKEIIVPFEPDFQLDGVEFHIPQRGDKLQLLKLSEQNAHLYKVEKLKQMKRLDPELHTQKILEMMRRDLQLDELPTHMECFDNSNIQGAFPVASCVVFKNAKPSKSDYRHFNIKTVVGPDDFASMEEILTRRYTRLMNEGQELPKLVIVDGGKGQLSSAVKVFKEMGIFGKVPLIGLAKRLEEIYFPNDPIPLYLSRNCETLKIIQHMRDEAHRFGITFHRNQRSRHFTSSELENIEGVGPKTIELLFKKFKAISAIKSASIEELSLVVGPDKAKKIRSYFDGKDTSAFVK